MKRIPIVLVTAAMTLAACGGSTAGPAASSSGGPSKVASIAAEVPSSVPTPIQIATDATYSPDEYIDPNTGDIVGWDIDLGKAICKVMGVACTFNNVTFDSIIPQLTASNPRYVLGISSFPNHFAIGRALSRLGASARLRKCARTAGSGSPTSDRSGP